MTMTVKLAKKMFNSRMLAPFAGVVFGCSTLLGAVAVAQVPGAVAAQPAVVQQAADGIPVGELNSNAPTRYTVQRGDTLWAISGLYLNRPWRWPELWGMNKEAIRNPHRIYPGQVLFLNVSNGYAKLGVAQGETGTIKLSPTIRSESLPPVALPTVRRDLIEPFLARPVIKDEAELIKLPDVLGSVDDRLIMGNGDLIYVRGTNDVPLSTREGSPRTMSIFRKSKPLIDPDTKAILGFESQYVGQANIIRDEFFEEVAGKRGRVVEEYRPATLEITKALTEVQIGDRLEVINEATDYTNFVPRLPPVETAGKVISLYADVAVSHAGSGEVVAINLGRDDGLETGHVLQILRKGRLARDSENGPNARIRLPDEPNGVLLVFRVYDQVSYGLIMDSTEAVTVGDKLVSP